MGGAVITTYQIEVSYDAGTEWSDLAANMGSAATTYTHTDLATSTTYHYRVSTMNSVGTGPASNVEHATTGAPAVTVPDAPTGLSAMASGSSQNNLSWTAPSSMDGAVITGYQIEVSHNAGTGWSDLVANTGRTSTTYVHAGHEMPLSCQHHQRGWDMTCFEYGKCHNRYAG